MNPTTVRQETPLIAIRRAEQRGHFDHGWLDAWHTFSFGGYADPRHDGFSVLRVINQDTIAPGKGFGTHGHEDMEIITYVLDGVLTHTDSMGHTAAIRPGEVQVMSAGAGLTHSEQNGSRERPVQLLQMWVLPARRGTAPRYAQRDFPDALRRNRLCLIASRDGRAGSLTIGQDVALYAAILDAEERVRLDLRAGRCAWLHLGRGRLRLNGEELRAGDGAAVHPGGPLIMTAAAEAEFVLFDLPEEQRQ